MIRFFVDSVRLGLLRWGSCRSFRQHVWTDRCGRLGRISGLPSGRPSLMPTPALPFWLDDEQFAQGLGLHLCRGAVLRTVFTLSSVVTVSLTSGMTSGVWVSSSLRPELCSASAGHFSENLLAYLPPALSSTLLPPSSPASPLRKQTGRRDSGCQFSSSIKLPCTFL